MTSSPTSNTAVVDSGASPAYLLFGLLILIGVLYYNFISKK